MGNSRVSCFFTHGVVLRQTVYACVRQTHVRILYSEDAKLVDLVTLL